MLVVNTFQHLMDQILGDLPYCFVYVDDILVFSKDLTSHIQHLWDMFLLCREYALKGPGKTISWTPLMDSAFSRAKRLLSSVPELVHPQCNAPISGRLRLTHWSCPSTTTP